MNRAGGRSGQAAIALHDRLGICQWFHYRDHHTVRRAVALLRELGVRRVRTGISWADDHRPDGPAWHDWVMRQLADFDVLLSVWHTPPSIAEGGYCNQPPRHLEEYAGFIHELCNRYGSRIRAIELWNEPNNGYKWDFLRTDPGWRKFARMIRGASDVLRGRGITAVLGGMIPVDPHWLRLMREQGALESIDVVAIHGFPEMWWRDHPNWEWHRDWHGWQHKLDLVRSVTGSLPIWITETGLATIDLDTRRRSRHALQRSMLLKAACASADRVYWYSLIDLDPRREAIEGFHVDENEYHLGLVEHAGPRKPAFSTMSSLLREPGPIPSRQRLASARGSA